MEEHCTSHIRDSANSTFSNTILMMAVDATVSYHLILFTDVLDE